MKDKIILWLISRFTEHSSVIGLPVFLAGAFEVYADLQSGGSIGAIAKNQALMSDFVKDCGAAVIGALVIITKDGNILDTFGIKKAS